MRRPTPSLTPEEARRLHTEALVIDAQQPPVTRGFLFTEKMRTALAEAALQGRARDEVEPLMAAMAVRELQTSEEARRAYRELWRTSGVTVACGTYSGGMRPGDAFEQASRRIAEAYAYVDALGGDLTLVRRAADIERVHRDGTWGLVLDFQNTTPFGDDLDRVDVFRDLGVRMVQLTYNLRNLVGDGCTEAYQGGLSHFGREVVRRLNEARILVDVSHCSEQVGWDALKVSSAPIVISHSSSKAICYHDRGKSDELARAVADRGGFFGVVVIPGFLSEAREVTLDDFCRHVEHLVNVCGIDHVGIGTDKAGPGPGTDSLVAYPETMPLSRPGAFDWTGFRREEHRLTPDYRLTGYTNFGDWPNLTIALARWGFDEAELRKLLGLNFLRVFREVVG
ncbi:MAG: membrane dipeptidase [Armatimonadota bacterium]|nr:membrane dipeptidase [Armatimonadota bacterium]